MKYVLYLHVSTLQSMYAVASMDVFISFLMLCFPGMLLMYFLNVVVFILH